jgi:hypothetical protein
MYKLVIDGLGSVAILLFSNSDPARSSFHYNKNGDSDVQPEFFVGGNSIEFVRVWSHLGHILRNDLNDNDDIEKRRLQTVKQINDVLCYFGKLDCVIKLKLLYSYCSSIYGSELWDLSCTALPSLCVSWRNGLKNVWKLPRNTHAQILYSLCEQRPIGTRFVTVPVDRIYSLYELIMLRDGIWMIETGAGTFLNKDDIKDIIYGICTE